MEAKDRALLLFSSFELGTFFKTVFIFLYVAFDSTSISLSPNCIALSPNLNFTATCSIVVVDSLTIALSSFSKVLMYNYHYDYIKDKYGNNSRLSFTDTDLLCMKLRPAIHFKIVGRTRKCLVFAIIHLSQNIITIQATNL